MPGLTKCHYEVLGVERTATDEDIKKSFRKLALQLHPDKNPDRMEEAKQEFQVLQQAYETLSNSQERAWYDQHRTALLKGGIEEGYDEDIFDIFPYMTSGCYKGFGDDAEGFYTVYRVLFEKLASEEYEARDEDEDSDDEIPAFGDSLSKYDDVVGPFYAYWESYCTHQNFGWMDEYDTRRAGHRRIARLMDKENKKLRAKARQVWNQKVRALVDFVKRKDKRIQAWKLEQERLLKEKEEGLKKKQAEDKARRIKERNKLFEQVKSSKLKHNEENQDQLEQLENWMADEFNEGDEFVEEEEEEEIMMEYCHPCQKAFRTQKALLNHEKSKKHLAQLEKWAEENNIATESEEEHDGVEDDDNDDDEAAEVEADPEVKESDPEIPTEKTENNLPDKTNGASSPTPHNDTESSEEELTSRFVSKLKLKTPVFEESTKQNRKKGKSKKQAFTPGDDDDDDEPTSSVPEIVSLEALKDDQDSFDIPSKKGGKDKKRRRANKGPSQTTAVAPSQPAAATAAAPTAPETSTLNPAPDHDDAGDEDEHPKSRKHAAATNSKSHQCGHCKEFFDSRSKLFKHIEKTGHALPPEAVQFFDDDRKSSKKSKARRK